MQPTSANPDRTIERARGETYRHATFAVYEHSTYPPTSVLAGQPRRVFVDGWFATVAEAQAKYPEARVIEGSATPASARDFLIRLGTSSR